MISVSFCLSVGMAQGLGLHVNSVEIFFIFRHFVLQEQLLDLMKTMMLSFYIQVGIGETF